jgi:hypothetical protein
MIKHKSAWRGAWGEGGAVRGERGEAGFCAFTLGLGPKPPLGTLLPAAGFHLSPLTSHLSLLFSTLLHSGFASSVLPSNHGADPAFRGRYEIPKQQNLV